MSTKKKPTQKPTIKDTPKPIINDIPKPMLKETSMGLVLKLSNAVICGDGDAVQEVNNRLDGFLKDIQEKRDAETASIQKCKQEMARLSVQVMAHYSNIQELDRLKIDTQAAIGSIASIGEHYREK